MAFGSPIRWLFDWKCKFGCRISSNIANYLKYNYLSKGDSISNVMLRLWTFTDLCSRHIVGVAGDDIMLNFSEEYTFSFPIINVIQHFQRPQFRQRLPPGQNTKIMAADNLATSGYQPLWYLTSSSGMQRPQHKKWHHPITCCVKHLGHLLT